MARFGGFTAAARRLQLTQPTLSLQVKALEQELGRRLLDRGSRGVKLTAEGRALYAMASRLFGLTPEECLAGVTREAARALGLGHDRGTLENGKRADIAVWDLEHPRELAYWLGTHPLSDLLIAGQSFSPNP